MESDIRREFLPVGSSSLYFALRVYIVVRMHFAKYSLKNNCLYQMP